MGQISYWRIILATGLALLLIITAVSCQQPSTADAPVTALATATILPTATLEKKPLSAPGVPTSTSIEEASPTPIPVTNTPMPSEMTPHMQVVFDFLTALQNGLTAAESGQYLSEDLQTAVNDGRPLPTIVGIRDEVPSFDLSDLTDNSLIDGAVIRAIFNYEAPTYAIFRLVQENDAWRIKNIAQHNLVQTAVTRDLLKAEFAIINYYQALANDQLDVALALLTSNAQQTFTADALTPISTGLRRVTVTTLQPVRASDERITFYIRLFTTPHLEKPGLWREGDNPRWLTLVRSDAGWQIDQIITSATLADVKTWERINISPINMTLDVPSEWIQAGQDWVWSPDDLGLPGVGVRWADLGDIENDDVLLPLNRQAISQQPISLGWSQGTQYTFQQIGDNGAAINAETHILVRSDRRVYDFYAVADTVKALDAMRPVLQRMVAAVVIHDPEATAYNSIEVTTSFLATLIRDRSGASSLPYLSEEMLEGGADYQALLHLLAVSDVYRSFDATWLENTADGQAKVLVTLHFADDVIQKRLFTLQGDDEGTWYIIKIEPTSG
ncbi:MAG: hypothetical protein DWQ04_17740 [Chloroflexi bacterium]|nr:MAG: hypothetical protein DWQ04_17740 [Chloroflexota bacterium]